eukprot:g20080.t1
MAGKEGLSKRNGKAPTFARFCPRDEYVSTFDMLHDYIRNRAYRAAVRVQADKPNADDGSNNSGSTPAPLRWLDIGTGSGLLASLVAAAPPSSPASEGVAPTSSIPTATRMAKAVEVYACEDAAEVANAAAETFAKNGGRVRLFRGRSTEMKLGRDLPARVPRVISELLGTGLLEEGLLPTLRDAQARLLSPGYVSIPDSAEVWAFCCESSEFHSMSRLLPQAAGRSELETHSGGSDKDVIAVDASREAAAKEGPPRTMKRVTDAATTASLLPASEGQASLASEDYAKPSPEAEAAISPTPRDPGEGLHVLAKEGVARALKDGPVVPPACLCGLHRTCPPWRIWMLNDRSRTDSFRSVVRSILTGCDASHHVAFGAENQQQDNSPSTSATVAVAGIKRRRATPVPACVACISDGFLLPLLAAQAGASDVLEIQPSAAYAAVCRDVYHANGVNVESDGNGDNDNDPLRQRVIRPFPGGVSSVYELLMSSPGSAASDNSGLYSAEILKLDAVIGEPFFADLSTATWPLEPLLLFWCARTALEAGGYFTPRTRVVPARARLLACPLACDLLFRGRRPVGKVEGVDMSAVNQRLGVGCAVVEPDSGPGNGGEDGGEGVKESTKGIESVRLSEYRYDLLGSPTAVLDIDLTQPLCDLRGGRKEIRCRVRQASSATEPGATEPAPQPHGQEARKAVCQGVALWLDISLDEEGLYRLSTGPEVPYWSQGVLFFEEGWVVPPSGGSFHLEAALEDGAVSVDML